MLLVKIARGDSKQWRLGCTGQLPTTEDLNSGGPDPLAWNGGWRPLKLQSQTRARGVSSPRRVFYLPVLRYVTC